MSASGILSIFIVFFVFELVFNIILSLLNIREVRKNKKVPEGFETLIYPETYEKSAAYTIDKEKFSIISNITGSIILLLVVMSGAFGILDNFLDRFGYSYYLHGIIFVELLAFFFDITELPFDIYSRFVIEEKYGFNKVTLGLFIKDKIKGGIISAVLIAIVLLGLFYFMDKSGSLWWIIAAAAFVGFQLILSILYPLIIAPLFNKFTPLEEGELKSRLEKLASENNFQARGIFVMDGSKRSAHSNAYFTGFGKSRRIVLFDTLLTSLTTEELEAILAHEIGHYKKHHIVKGFILSIFIIAISLFIINILYGYLPLYKAFGFNQISYHGIIVLLSFCSSPFLFFLTPIFNKWSRKHEYEADRFAVMAVGSWKGLVSGLVKLTRDNLSNLTPHPLYSFFHYSHPVISERIRAAKKIAPV